MATGGTIASVEGDDGLTPGIGASHLFSLVPRANEKVFLLKLMLDTSPEIFDWVVASGINGLAQEAFGMGGLHYIRRNLVEKLRMLREKGVRVIAVTQCMYEKADLSIYEVGAQMLRAEVLSGMDMTTEAAVTKLMWALAQEDTDRWLSENLCGEVRTGGR